MKIKNFIPDNRHFLNGLSISKMANLKQVVALFGKNGAGKSRLLSLVQSEINTKMAPARNLDTKIKDLERMKENRELDESDAKEYIKLKQQWDKLWAEMEFEFNDQVIVLSPLETQMQTSDMLDSAYRQLALDLINNPRYEKIKPNALKLIKSFCKSEISKEYYKTQRENQPYYRDHEILEKENIEILKSIKQLIHDIMNKEFSYSTDEHLTPILLLNGHEIEVNGLSAGEQELLAYCVFIAIQSKDNILNGTVALKGKIIMIDEPETFLHPQAQIDLIRKLKYLVGENGQIWIATHSLAILSILDRDEIWFVDDGKVTSPSIETPSKALKSLIGEENIDTLENFLASKYEWAAIKFALESLSEPPVSIHKENDPQQNQVLDRLSVPQNPLRILDFGAGHGRIAQEILRNKSIAEKIYYQPLEENKNFLTELKALTEQLKQISKVEPTKEREVLNSYLKLKESEYKDFFDYVLLINVLHELPVNKWSAILNALLGCLKEDGKLLILEDQAIPRGENAHEYGFIILNIEEFKKLFSLENNPKSYKHKDSNYADRLTCIEIPKNANSITNECIIEAFKRKKDNCGIDIKELKKKTNKKADDGRKHSFFSQLYTNVDMAIEELSGGKKTEN